SAERYAFFSSCERYYTFGVSFSKINGLVLPAKQEPITVDRDFDNFGRINDLMYKEQSNDGEAIQYFVIPNRWFHKMKDTKVTLLTTELMPTAIAEHIGFKTSR